MTLRQTIFVAVLTAIYLCFELAFNARLLDVVGGGASQDQIHSIEIFGRTLSGVALALFVLQGLLWWRNGRGGDKPGNTAIVLTCALAGTLVFASLQLLTDYLVDSSSGSFRRASLNIVLVQGALVHDTARLDGLTEDNNVFARPEGKAFLALFPLMAVSVDRLDEKIRNAKLELLKQGISARLGGPGNYFDSYQAAVKEAFNQWKRYDKAGDSATGEADIARHQDKAWNDYVRDLGRRGWSPYTIPDRARDTVLRKVRAKVPVPENWDLADEEVFREAVAKKIRGKNGGTSDSVSYGGKRLPLGMSWPVFFRHPAVQGELRNKLELPAGVLLRLAYSADEFEREIFNVLVAARAKRELSAYDAAPESYVDGAKNAKKGRDAARAAIVPPLALFFSLLGAIGHLSKMIYLLIKIGTNIVFRGKAAAHYLWAIPLAVLALAWAALTVKSNNVTESRIFTYLRNEVIRDSDGSLQSRLLANALHVVAVGQGLSYPVNEKIRTQVLGGITYGYRSN